MASAAGIGSRGHASRGWVDITVAGYSGTPLPDMIFSRFGKGNAVAQRSAPGWSCVSKPRCEQQPEPVRLVGWI
jgi:hypothetical protein